MLCRRVLLAVCMLCLYEYENMFTGHCDALRCVRYAFVAAPALHAMPCMTVKDVWSVTVREYYVVHTWHVCAFSCESLERSALSCHAAMSPPPCSPVLPHRKVFYCPGWPETGI